MAESETADMATVTVATQGAKSMPTLLNENIRKFIGEGEQQFAKHPKSFIDNIPKATG